MRQAGLTYLVATQIGTAFLLVMFLVLGGRASNSAGAAAEAAASAAASSQAAMLLQRRLDFANFTESGRPLRAPCSCWRSSASAPRRASCRCTSGCPRPTRRLRRHVSALMSGVMIKTGIYGSLRMLTFLGAPAPWWGWTPGWRRCVTSA